MGCNQLLLVYLLIVLSVNLSLSSKCKLAQRDALLKIQSPIQHILWNVSEDCCLWRNVACDKSGNVISLSLFGFTQENTLLPNSSLFDLPFLQTLELASNGHPPLFINASIPNQIGKLTELRSLLAFGCGGPIPSSIGNLTKLQELTLTLTHGGLTGNIPDSIGNLRQLTVLYLAGERISGTIPDSFRSLTNLETLTLNTNLTGNLPRFLLDLPNLQFFSANWKRLQGPLPRNIRPDSKLQHLDLGGNNFTGMLPAWIFTRRLVTVFLGGNSFSGQIEPFRMPHVSYLRNVDLSGNRIEGIPTSLFNLKNLSTLVLDYNKLSGALDFALLGGMRELRELSLSGNEGLTLKSSKGVLGYPPLLYSIRMEHCGLTEFPNFLSSADSLYGLEVNDNKMKGGIDFSSGWKNLHYLNAWNNELGGPLMAAPPALSSLNLSHNQFTGKIPANYCRQMGLSSLDISFNKISGCKQFKHKCNSSLTLLC